MSRSPRVYIQGISLHVIQRGNNRMVIFRQPADHEVFLALLQRAAVRSRVSLHGYVLMTNHFHLIATPTASDSLPRMMKVLGGAYVSYYNRRYERVGTLWNGRYRGLVLDDERYWLTCLRYIEQNPIRAGIADMPVVYPWSSYRAHACGEWPDWLTPHPVYQALGVTGEERQLAYRALCECQVLEKDAILVR